MAIPPNIAAAVAARDRDDEDRALDASERPAELLAFCGVPTGARVALIPAGRGYMAELVARAVGPAGRVYGQNTPDMLLFHFEERWSGRLAKPVNANILRIDGEYDDPLPPWAALLDLVISTQFNPILPGRGEIGAQKMHKNVFAALKPGGVYCLVDDDARMSQEPKSYGPGGLGEPPGPGDVALALDEHREETLILRQDLESVGFILQDDGTGPWFALRFVKPRAPGHRRAHRDGARPTEATVAPPNASPVEGVASSR